MAALERLAREAVGIAAIVGFAEPAAGSRGAEGERRSDSPSRRPVHNAIALLEDGQIAAVYRKNRLPNYGVFDEVRYFEPGTEPVVAEIAGRRGGADDLRGPLGARPAGVARGARRARG